MNKFINGFEMIPLMGVLGLVTGLIVLTSLFLLIISIPLSLVVIIAKAVNKYFGEESGEVKRSLDCSSSLNSKEKMK